LACFSGATASLPEEPRERLDSVIDRMTLSLQVFSSVYCHRLS
jgi:hypothetical protein